MNIFVSVICYEDIDVLKTVADLYKQATYPDLIRTVVILQSDDRHKYLPLLQIHKNVELRAFDVSWAEGCGKARAEAVKYYNGEKYFFQSDSHMRFDPEWDKLLMDEMQECPADKPILTTLPPNFVIATEKKDPQCVSHLMLSRFFHHLPLHVGASHVLSIYKKTDKPRRTGFVAGGVMFGPGSVCEEVKPDPYFYFHGEEFTFNMRLWTSGYTNFTPRFSFCYHAYRTFNPGPRLNSVLSGERDVYLHQRSLVRAHALLGIKTSVKVDPEMLIDLEYYPLGSVRTVKDWEDTFKINLQKETAEPEAYYNFQP